jgi:hypothetical protein
VLRALTLLADALDACCAEACCPAPGQPPRSPLKVPRS